MKEAIGNASLATIVLTFVGIIMTIFLGTLSYTKAFKVKNRIVDIIEQYSDGYSRDNREEIDKEVAKVLGSIGYRINSAGKTCPNRNGAVAIDHPTANYRYCIYEYDTTRGKYYGVTAYMYFDFPIIGQHMEFPVSGETKVFFHIVD